MRISDWSSDVCSADEPAGAAVQAVDALALDELLEMPVGVGRLRDPRLGPVSAVQALDVAALAAVDTARDHADDASACHFTDPLRLQHSDIDTHARQPQRTPTPPVQ